MLMDRQTDMTKQIVAFHYFVKATKKETVSFVMSVCLSVLPHGTSRLPLNGILRNLILGNFITLCRENSNLVEIGQKIWDTLRKGPVSFVIMCR
jgi:hypothetical protein